MIQNVVIKNLKGESAKSKRRLKKAEFSIMFLRPQKHLRKILTGTPYHHDGVLILVSTSIRDVNKNVTTLEAGLPESYGYAKPLPMCY